MLRIRWRKNRNLAVRSSGRLRTALETRSAPSLALPDRPNASDTRPQLASSVSTPRRVVTAVPGPNLFRERTTVTSIPPVPEQKPVGRGTEKRERGLKTASFARMAFYFLRIGLASGPSSGSDPPLFRSEMPQFRRCSGPAPDLLMTKPSTKRALCDVSIKRSNSGGRK